ncbi:MAG: DNA polymerase III subunit delta [Bacteroidota bacterium]
MMTQQEFHTALKQRKFAQVYFFFGEEDFLIDEAVSTLIATVLRDEDQSFNLDVLYGDEVDAQDVVAHANSYPMMTQHRVVILRNFERLDDEGKKILYTHVEKASQSTVMVIISKKTDSILQRKAATIEFGHPKESELLLWIKERGRKYGREISRDAYEVLITYVGNSLRALDSELEKISSYIGDKKTIDADDVHAVVGFSKTYNVFELSKAVGNRDLKRSLEIFYRMMQFGEHPPVMVVMITKNFMRMLKLAEGGQRLRSYSKSEIERGFASLARADEKLKFTGEDPRSVMTILLHELMPESKRAIHSS